jgi:hypothetical protein
MALSVLTIQSARRGKPVLDLKDEEPGVLEIISRPAFARNAMVLVIPI